MPRERLRECPVFVTLCAGYGTLLAGVGGAMVFTGTDDAFGAWLGMVSLAAGGYIAVAAALRGRRSRLVVDETGLSGLTAVGGIVRLRFHHGPAFVITRRGPCVRVAANMPKSRETVRVFYLTDESVRVFAEFGRRGGARIHDKRPVPPTPAQ